MTVPPQSVEELQTAIVGHDRLTIRGCGTKSAPRVGTGAATIDTSHLRGITDYSPDECVFTALAGTPLAEIESTLGAHGQYMPFDPVLVRTGATLGGTVASGLCGSGRYRYGGVRDFVIGMRVIDGDGRLIRSGGKVVKNAAGFLLHHGMVGSLGRLGVIADITCKVFPRPEAHATLEVACGSLERAWSAVGRLQMARRDVEAVDFDSGGTLWVRIAGRSESLISRLAVLQDLLGGEEISSSTEASLWGAAREFAWVSPTDSIIKVAAATLRQAGSTFSSARYFCAGACAWITTADPSAIAGILAPAGLRGQIVRGENAGALIGRVEPSPFETRVRRVLDPHNRFDAASDSSR
jgi:glycolate oxidase FAD binding subunit